MSNDPASPADKDLLNRLNALKKTHIDLDDKKYRIPVTAHIEAPVDPSPARSLHNDLISRFKTLDGTGSRNKSSNVGSKDANDDLLAEEDSKTVEELLAELGGEGAWNIEKDEATQIDDLLRSANFALKDTVTGESKADNDMRPGNSFTHELPNLDVEFSRPLPDDAEVEASDEEDPRKSKQELEADIDREAHDIIAQLRDELKNASLEDENEQNDDHSDTATPTTNLPSAPAFDLPTIPATDPKSPPQAQTQTDSTVDNDLASRFASLGRFPAAPSNALPSAPSTKPGSKPTKFGASARYEGHTNEEIDSWCIICCEDATLRCPGCDGDLYCVNCWMEGHRGPDAGYEERQHKALQFNKGAKKEPRRRIAI